MKVNMVLNVYTVFAILKKLENNRMEEITQLTPIQVSRLKQNKANRKKQANSDTGLLQKEFSLLRHQEL